MEKAGLLKTRFFFPGFYENKIKKKSLISGKYSTLTCLEYIILTFCLKTMFHFGLLLLNSMSYTKVKLE